MQNSIKEKKRNAVLSSCFSTLLILSSAIIKLVLRYIYLRGTFWGSVLLILSILELGTIFPVWINLHARFLEIEGGEEDAAAQY